MRDDRWRPLTQAQAAVWYAQRLDPANPVYNCAQYVEIHGPLDPGLLEEALRATVAETDVLNLAFGEGPDGPRQWHTPQTGWPFTAEDLGDRPDPDAEAIARMRADLARPVPLDTGEPLFATAVYRIAADRHLWYLRIHHLAVDGYAFTSIVSRVAERYTAIAEGSDDPRGRFGRLSELLDEEAAYHTSTQHTADRAFWLDRFADRPDVAGLTEATAPSAHRFIRSEGRLPSDTTARLRALADAAKVSWPELAMAAVAVYTHKMTGGDVVLGVPSMGRLGSAAARVPATVVNIVPLRVPVEPDMGIADVVRAVRGELSAVRAHQRYRYEELLRDLRLLGSGRRLFGPQVNIKAYGSQPRFGAASGTVHYLSAGPVEDIEVIVYPDGDTLKVDVDANPDLYGPDETAAHHDRIVALLATIAGAPAGTTVGALGVCTAEERHRTLTTWNDTTHPVPAACLVDLLDAQTARTPAATALVSGETELSYAELDAAANRLARHLIELGAGPGGRVAVAAPRSPDLLVALLAVVKTGAAYVPVDPDYPPARTAFMLTDAAPACLVTAGGPAGAPPGGNGLPRVALDDPDTAATIAARPGRPVTDADRVRPLNPADPAYVIYTSGSTGEPKGVVIAHRGIVNRLAWMQAEFGLTGEDRVLQKTSSSFDVSVWEFFWPLITGAALVLARPGGHRDPAYLAGLIRMRRVTTAHFVPSMLEVFLAEPAAADCTVLRRVVCSGETLPARAARRFHATLPGVPLYNLYGPTEASVDVTAWRCRPDAGEDPVPIGRPIWNTRTYVLDAGLRPVPPGVTGELYLAGVQLAIGYLGRPGLTAERFVPDPYGPQGTRMYRTGDLVRWRDDGTLEFRGHADRQLKIRGFRVEPGEIEAALARLPGVAQVAVDGRADRTGGARLLGYVVPAADVRLEPAVLRTALAEALPAHLVPADLVIVDALPLTANGKLDASALPEPSPAPACRVVEVPRTPREEALCGLFAEVLDLPRVAPGDGFFDLGGHSLLAARLIARVRDVLGVDADLGAVFAAPTPAALAHALDPAFDGASGGGALDVLLPLRPAGTRPGLFCVHPAGGIGWCYAGLLRHLPSDRPVYAVQARGLAGPAPLPGSIEEMAADYVRRIRAAQPDGPYHLLGWSIGGVIAHAAATRLQEQGAQVGLLALLDAYPSDQWRDLAPPDERTALRAVLYMAGHDEGILGGAPAERDRVLAALHDRGSALARLGPRVLSAIVDVVINNAHLMRTHRHERYDGDALFFTAAAPREQSWLTRAAWRPYIRGVVENHDVACTHPAMMRPGPLAEIGAVLAARLAHGAT